MAVKLGNGKWAIKEDKLLAYNDNSGLFFNKEFDFSRGSTATYVAKDGLIKTAGIQPNVVSNGDFSDGSTNWTLGSDWTVGDSKVIGDNSDTESTQQIFPDNTSRILRIKYTLTVDSGQVAVYMSGQVKDWKTASGTYTDTITTTSKTIEFDGRNSDPFSGTITDIIVQEIQTDTPRIDFTNDTKGHLLLEPSRTNYATYSNDISQFTTLAVGGTVTETANYAEAPNGENEATRLQMSASGSNYALKGVVTSAFNDDYYISIYLKSNTSENQQVTIYGRNSLTQSYTVTPQWQRFQVSCNNASGSAFFYFGSRPSYSSDENLDILAWGGQLEQGDYSTSLINTTGAASTRNADVCNNSGSAQDFNSEEGVLYAEISALTNDLTNRQISINNGTTTDRVQLFYSSSSNQISVFYKAQNGTTQFSLYEALSDISQFNKIAFKWKTNDFALWINGVETDTVSSGVTSTANSLTNLDFNQFNGGADFYGNVRNLQVFTEALTDEQLEKLTS